MPDHWESRNIFEAVENDDEASIRYFVEKENASVTATNILNITLAHIAAEHGQLNILKYLVEKDASLVEMVDMWNQTVLHLATRKGSLKMVEYLVDVCNATIRPLSHIFHCNNVVHIAAENGRLGVLQYFVERKKVDAKERNTEGQPPVFLAATHDHLHIVEYLMDDANVDVMMVDNERRTILHMCVDYGYRQVPQFLLDQRKLPFDLNARDVNGRTVLHCACLRKNAVFVKYLVEKKRMDVNQTDDAGWTPLHQAVNESNYKLVEYFVQRGTGVNIRDSEGRTALDLATDEKIIKYLNGTTQNRTRRAVIEQLSYSSWQTDVPRLGSSSSFEPISYDINLSLTLANIFVRLFKPSIDWQSIERVGSLWSTPGDIILHRINSIAEDVIRSISDGEFAYQ